MHLSQLNPKWLSLNGWASDKPFYIGLSFDCQCPECKKQPCPTCGHTPHKQRLIAKFWPPIDPNNVAKDFAMPYERQHLQTSPGGVVFDRTGDTFEDISLNLPMRVQGHWQCQIVNGQVVEV